MAARPEANTENWSLVVLGLCPCLWSWPLCVASAAELAGSSFGLSLAATDRLPNLSLAPLAAKKDDLILSLWLVLCVTSRFGDLASDLVASSSITIAMCRALGPCSAGGGGRPFRAALPSCEGFNLTH